LRQSGLRASTGGVLAKKRTQNVSEYMLVLALCLVTFCLSRRRRKMYCGHPRLCVYLSAAVRPHYCTDPDVTWGRGRGRPLVVHYWADLQSVHRLRCYGNITRTLVTFCVSRRRRKMYRGHACLCVCLSVRGRMPTVLHGPDVTWGSGRGCPLVVHYCSNLQTVYRLRCYGNITRTLVSLRGVRARC